MRLLSASNWPSSRRILISYSEEEEVEAERLIDDLGLSTFIWFQVKNQEHSHSNWAFIFKLHKLVKFVVETWDLNSVEVVQLTRLNFDDAENTADEPTQQERHLSVWFPKIWLSSSYNRRLLTQLRYILQWHSHYIERKIRAGRVGRVGQCEQFVPMPLCFTNSCLYWQICVTWQSG